MRLTILDGLRASIEVEVSNLSGRGMHLRIPCDIPPGTLVRIDSDDALYLGEVCHCRPVEGHYEAGIKLDQVLSGLSDLEKLNQNLIKEEKEQRELASR